MAPPKGQSGNPSGVPRGHLLALKRLRGLTPIAISRLGQLVKSDNEQVALGAAREILDRVMGKPRQQVAVEGKIELAADAHLQALQALTAKAVPVLDLEANRKQLISLDNSDSSSKLDIKTAEVIDVSPMGSDDDDGA